MVGPLLMSYTEYDGKVVVGKDVDANQEFAAKYGVIPTVLIFITVK
jgi:thioredoxin-like negative regulator of GroEL